MKLQVTGSGHSSVKGVDDGHTCDSLVDGLSIPRGSVPDEELTDHAARACKFNVVLEEQKVLQFRIVSRNDLRVCSWLESTILSNFTWIGKVNGYLRVFWWCVITAAYKSADNRRRRQKIAGLLKYAYLLKCEWLDIL